MPNELAALRASDPARHMTPESGPQLDAAFARIPMPDVDTGRAAKTKPFRRSWIAPMLLLVTVGSAAAVTGVLRPWERDDARTAGPGTSQPNAAAVFAQEYADATAALKLPPGVSWPKQTAPTDAIFGTGRGGHAEAMAVAFAKASWECELVRADGVADRAAVDAAAAQLFNLIDHHMVDVPAGSPEDGAAPEGIPGPVMALGAGGQEPATVMLRRWVDDAVAGDVRNLRDSCQANMP